MPPRPTRRNRLAWLQRLLPGLLAAAGIAAGVLATRLNMSAAGSGPLFPKGTATHVPGEVSLPVFSAPIPQGQVLRQSLLFTDRPRRPRVDVVRYTVQAGDSVFGIADRFGLKPETILWGNFVVLKDDPHMLRPGQELTILPVDGTYYQWQAGDDLDAVAEFFGVAPSAILDWPGNNLSPVAPKITPGSWLVVPGGRRAFRQWFVPAIARGRAGVGTAYGPGGCVGDFSGGAVGTGGFVWPTPNHYVAGNDYWSGHLAIDLAAGEGTGVWAADSGVAVFAGWSTGGYGYMIMLDHGNGWQTVYAHLSQVLVACGQSVSQGELIGRAGSTGNSTGPHLHFETRFEGGFVNPWYVLP